LTFAYVLYYGSLLSVMITVSVRPVALIVSLHVYVQARSDTR